MRVLGCDFSSRPTARKPITMALGRLLAGDTVVLQDLLEFASLEPWAAWLARPADSAQSAQSAQSAWVGGFDLPFGLPRELVEQLGWPTDWAACMDHYASLTRQSLREQFRAFCAARPAGGKFAHRATDGPAGASPSMKWVNPPVAYMLHAGLPLLRAAGVHLPGLQPPGEGDARRVALEAYPGMLARAVIGRLSYKSDEPARQTPERHQARVQLLAALESGDNPLALRLRIDAEETRNQLLADGSGDRLDAVICMLQAAWAAARHAQGDALYGLPHDLDPLEGWIVTAQA
ncbi:MULTISPECIES: DUF429 domain-containing protein [unclassified Delftia]|uniref:DUF429 domain-containing protein n=1 Tax=unclassified Delftia TaxID=2613839 RepID=UPI0019001B46|nr:MULTISPECIES: DUF429 domain-containing protein [unclassified Delftia]MBK0112609.1 DUF429 domain-containing protein [Delftia sp. S65]MBK0118022.1 DUF429 domain-containing protein [Delftia sp. S67]MBK0131971.1 DUF429 domain-containing protein [Delftia sp. S66]